VLWTVRCAAAGDASRAGRQRHLLGHTAFVVALAVGSDGSLLVSGQEGKEAAVRLWDVASGACLAILCGEPRRGGGEGWETQGQRTTGLQPMRASPPACHSP
jgi:hypothetical protein